MFIEPIGPVECVRDEGGWFYHPIFNCCDDNDEILPANFFSAFGVETRTVMMEEDLDGDTFEEWVELGDIDISLWNPSRPDGDGWFVLVIDDTEDGPRCIWGRELATHGEEQ
jgi:hypothetical protein